MKSTNGGNTAHETADRMASGAHEAVDRIAESTNDAADSLEAKGRHLKDAQEQWFASLRGYVHANPATSLGLALAAGFLASRILNSR